MFVATTAGATPDDGIPITGDWNGDGHTTAGWFDDGEVFLRNANSSGSADLHFHYGRAGDIPVVGDWNGDGRDTLGVIRDRTWHLRFENAGGGADLSFIYGRLGSGDYALAGDWNGDGRDGVGIVRNGQWHLRNSLNGGPGEIVFRYGRVHQGDIPLVGDWTGDGIDTPAIVRDGTWHIRHVNRGGHADQVLRYGRESDLPVVGDWNADGRHTPGIVRGTDWYLRHNLSGGDADNQFDFGPHAGSSQEVPRDEGHDHGNDQNPEDDRHDDHGEVDVVVTGDQPHGFTVPAGETWQVKGEVETRENVVVHGTLKMRPGAILAFVDVDESAFVGGGMDVLDTDVGLWVMGHGRLDVQGTPKQGWNRTGTHTTWAPDDEYVRAPHAKGERDGKPWNLGDAVPCVDFAGSQYCAEVANLTRDVAIQGTPDGKAHIFIHSHRPQTIKHALLRHLGPEIDDEEPDGRYALHFHHGGDGSRGSLVEGTIVRDADDHAYSPHESNGITFRDTVAYNVRNTAYWWDPGDISNDILYERALVIHAVRGRDSTGSMSGFRMAKGQGNVVRDSAAAGIQGGRASSGFNWREGPDGGNKWAFVNNVAHNNSNGVYHWLNEPHNGDESHVQDGFVTYHNTRFGIEQGAYTISSLWSDVVSFGNRSAAIRQRGAPRHALADPGISYRGGALGGGSDRSDHVIEFAAMRNCGRDSKILFEDLDLVQFNRTPILVDHDGCAHDDGNLHVVFRNVTAEGADLTPDDFTIEAIPDGANITVERTDGETFTIEP